MRYYGEWMREEAFKRIGHLYPKAGLADGTEATVIAWLWTRTVRCPNPACGAQMPLVRSFALSTKKGKETWVEPIVDREAKTVRFEVQTGSGKPPEGTVNRRGARCIVCDTSVPFDHVRAEGKAGRMSQRLMAIVAEGTRGRIYLPPDEDQVRVAESAHPEWAPGTDLPEQALGFRVQLYGMTQHADLFTPRQLVALTTFSDLVGEARERVLRDARDGMPEGDPLHEGGTGAVAYADAVATYLALGVSRLSDICNALCMWESSKTQARHLFTRQAIPMLWDFAEPNVFARAAGDYGTSLDNLAKVVDTVPAICPGQVTQQDAARQPSQVRGVIVSTDPPYYDNISYADLSDFFYAWMRDPLRHIYPELFATLLVPKSAELVATPYRFTGGRAEAENFFQTGLESAFGQMGTEENSGFPLTVYYAFKQAETGDSGAEVSSTGWETMLEGLLRAGLGIAGTWPMRSELSNRPRNMNSNALASSILLVCRPRPETASLATRSEFLRALKRELPGAIRKMQQGNIAPVDLAQASIGPGMAVFSRYAKVLEASGDAMSVRTALGIINTVLDEVLQEQESEYDADTRWAVAWFEQFGAAEGPYGDALTLSTAKDTSIEAMREAGILQARAGKVRLLGREELERGFDPRTDTRLTVWELTQRLVHAISEGSESEAAELLARAGTLGEVARDLAYRLFLVADRKGWTQEALAYNGLVTAWSEITKLSGQASSPGQAALFGEG